MSAQREARAFLLTWTLAVTGATSALLVHLGLRGRNVELGYEVGRMRVQESKLLESKRVLELEAASYKNSERVGVVARSLFGMAPPPPERVLHLNVKPRASMQVAPNDTPGDVTGTQGAAP